MADRKLPGKIARERIRLMQAPRPPEGVIGGYRALAPGDIVFADDTGVCFIPRARAAEVLELARKKAAARRAAT